MIWLVLARAETTLLLRSPLALVNAVLLPIGLGVGWLLLARNSGTPVGGTDVAMQLLMLLGFTPYTGAVTMLAARRQERVLRRLRESALTPAGVWAGLLWPYLSLGVVQAVVLVAITLASGGTQPVRWWPIVVALLLGLAMVGVLAVATAAVTPAPELAQLTTAPVFVLLFAGGLWLIQGGGTLAELLPGGAVAGLLILGWQPGSPWLAIGALAGATALGAAAIALTGTSRWWGGSSGR